MPDPDSTRPGLFTRVFQVAFTHRVFFDRRVTDPANPTLDQALGSTRRALITIEENVHIAHPDYAACLAAKLGPRSAGSVLVLPGGEACKHDESVYQKIVSAIHQSGIDRHEALIAIGGGAFLDAAGFAAATAHRGVRLLRFPTTTLAQADSGVGVKNGLNTFGKKNFTGTFHVPFAVVNDLDFLITQNAEECVGGLIEAVKVALIKDPEFFTWIASNVAALRAGEREPLAHAVRLSAEWHFRHITEGGDPFEQGSSRPLDFGHWAAHKLESMSGHALSHARAVAIGLALDVTYAMLAGWLSLADHTRILQVLGGLGLPVFDPLLAEPGSNGLPRVLDGLEEFREHLGGELTVLMLDGIGLPREIHALDPHLLVEAIQTLSAMAAHGEAKV